MSSVQAVRRPSPIAILRRRDFGLMWVGELISTIGSSFTAIAAGILVYRQTDSALAVGLMLGVSVLPSLLVGLIAGVFVDRWDRKRILVSADLVRGVLIALIPLLVSTSIVWLYVLVFAASTIQQFFDPAKESVIPDLASDEELEAANSLLAISSFGSTAVGFGAAGLIAAFDINLAFYIDAASFLLSALCIAFVRIAPHEATGAEDEGTSLRTINANLREGLAFLVGSPVLRSVLIVALIYSLSVGLWNSLLLPFSVTALGATEFEYGLQEGLTSVGFVIGSLLLAGYANRLYDGQWIVISLLGSALCGFAYALAADIRVAIAVVAVSGFMNAPFGIGRRTLVQRNTTRAVRGRVASAYFVASSALFLPGMLLAGLADVIEIRLLMGLVAVLWLVAGLLGLVLPGLARPAAEWRRALTLLRTAPAAPVLGAGRAATLADFERLAGLLPLVARLGGPEREAFVTGSTVREAGAGTSIVRAGEESSAAYFVLSGSLVAGSASGDGEERILSTMNPGDFFGEIAALTGSPRTANVLAQEPSELLEVTAETLRALVADPAIEAVVRSTMVERLARTGIADLPRFAALDQVALRDLRTRSAE